MCCPSPSISCHFTEHADTSPTQEMPNIEYEPNDKGHFSEYYVNTEDISENDRHYESDHNFINSESTDDCFPNYYIFSYSIWKDENENEQNFESEYNDIY